MQKENEIRELRKALIDSNVLIMEAQEILTQYLHPDSSQDVDETANKLLYLLDGPKQREVQKNIFHALKNSQRYI